MGCGASSAAPVDAGVDPKHWPAVMKLMDEAERQRARAVAAETRLRHLQRLVAVETTDGQELARLALPKGSFGALRSTRQLDAEMRRHATTSDWWWMADNESSLTRRPSDTGAPSAPPPPPRRRVVLPPLEPLEG